MTCGGGLPAVAASAVALSALAFWTLALRPMDYDAHMRSFVQQKANRCTDDVSRNSKSTANLAFCFPDAPSRTCTNATIAC